MSARRWSFASWRRRARTIRPDWLERLPAQNGVQVYLQSGGLETIRPLTEPAVPLTYALEAGDLPSSSGPPTSSKSTARSILPWCGRPWTCCSRARAIRYWTCFAAWAISRCPWRSGPAGPWASREMRRLVAKARANAGRNGVKNANFFAENLFEPAHFGAWAEDPYDLVLLDPPRAGALEIMERMAQWRPASSRVYFLPSREFGARCGDLGAGPRVPADRRGSDGHVSAYDARRIGRGFEKAHEPGAAHGRPRRNDTERRRSRGVGAIRSSAAFSCSAATTAIPRSSRRSPRRSGRCARRTC